MNILLTLFLGISLQLIKAHTPWGPCATVYLEPDEQGEGHEICHSGFLSNATNDQISSITIPEGFNMRLFDTNNFTGHFLDIQAGNWTAPPEWDNIISSVQYNNWGDGCALIYTDVNRTGDAFKVCNDANLTDGYGGAFVSIWVAPLHFFRLFKNDNFTGDWLDVRGTLTLREEWANQTKSMTLRHWDKCAWFWNGLNATDRLFQVCDNGTFPDAWSQKALSVTIPVGVTVTAFKEKDYLGESQNFTNGTYDLPAEWQNAIASVAITIDKAMRS